MGCCKRRKHTDLDDDGISAERARSAITHLLCGIYALIVIVLGLVFPMSAALKKIGGYAYLELLEYMQWVFHLYVYATAIIFLLYLHAYLLRQRRPPVTQRNMRLVSNNQMDSPRANSPHSLQSPGSPDKSTFAQQEGSDISGSREKEHHRSRSLTPSDVDVEDYRPVAAVTNESQGVNFYLRLGAIVFGTGSMIHDGFKVAAVLEEDMNLTCTGPLYLVVDLVHLTFVFFQTFYIFKSHRVVINKHKAFVRLGLTHMIAANIVVWIQTVVNETAETFIESSHEATNEHETALEGHHSANMTTSVEALEPSSHGPTLSTLMDLERCFTGKNLARLAAPFLYPCTIEYSLIAAAVLYKMFENVGRAGHRHLAVTSENTQEHADCHKANKGLFVGLFVGILTLIAVSTFFVFKEKDDSDTMISSLIFYITELTLLSLSAFAVCLGFFKLQQLKFTAPEEESQLDCYLLIISLFGLCVYNGFNAVASITLVLKGDLLDILALGAALLAFLQGAIQTIFILDGQRRCAEHDDHMSRKPGRALVTFLLLCNLSLWIINTFEVSKVEAAPIHSDFYGFLPWKIISHLCMPMLIFFRFHSSVCLSDIWINAYVIKKKEV